MASFSSTVYTDRFFLIVQRKELSTTASQFLSQPFEPFEWQLWLMIVAVFAFTGILVEWEQITAEDEVQRDNHRGCKIILPESAWSGIPKFALRGLAAFSLGELKDLKLVTSGSW